MMLRKLFMIYLPFIASSSSSSTRLIRSIPATMGVTTRSRKLAAAAMAVGGKPSKRKPKRAKTITSEEEQTPVAPATTANHPLLTLSPDCCKATLLCRPSKRNRSPYVADILLLHDNREAICHMPNLDMGGKCVPGVTLWVEPMKDKKTGKPIGSETVSPKYGTPKCEFSARLVHVDETDLNQEHYRPTWVGGHPTLGERIAEEIIRRHVEGITLIPGIGPIDSFQTQVTIGPHTRSDFVLGANEKNKTKKRIIEVKTVVDTDYCADWKLPERRKCVFTSSEKPYRRKALFPWGQSTQKGPDGEKVVSTRAIKHVMELTELVQKKEYDATILFIVIRGDAEVFRPNQEACPSFSRYLKEAQEGGVQLLAKRVRWGDGDEDMGKCYDDQWLDVEFPSNPVSSS